MLEKQTIIHLGCTIHWTKTRENVGTFLLSHIVILTKLILCSTRCFFRSQFRCLSLTFLTHAVLRIARLDFTLSFCFTTNSAGRRYTFIVIHSLDYSSNDEWGEHFEWKRRVYFTQNWWEFNGVHSENQAMYWAHKIYNLQLLILIQPNKPHRHTVYSYTTCLLMWLSLTSIVSTVLLVTVFISHVRYTLIYKLVIWIHK